MAKASMSSIKREPPPPARKPEPVRKPTEEQKQAIAVFMTKRDLLIKAGAGCGKTSTLVMMANATRRVGRYLAFNKALVEESKGKFPRNVGCSTVHSLAWHAIVKDTNYKQRLEGHRIPMSVLADKLGITVGKGYERFRGKGTVVLEPRQQAAITKAAVEQFCQSADDEPQLSHVPWQKTLSKPANDQLKEDLLPYVRTYWKDVKKPNGTLPYNPACYLKQYELSNPIIPADFIFMDEAQDLSPVMISIVQQQVAQIIWVGDDNQQIYEFTGAVNAMARVKGGRRAMLTMSFRFGQPIADVANEVLVLIPGAELRLRGCPGVTSSVGEVKTPTAVLTRTNAAAIEALLTSGKKVHVVGGGEDIISFCWAAGDLQAGKKDISHPELSCFKTWAEVGDYADESGDSDLKLKVKLIDRFGPRRIAGALRNQPSEEEAEIVYSTAHKSKGREWDSVRISEDFVTPKVCTCGCGAKLHDHDGEGACFKCDDCMMFVSRGLTPQEARLLYVAVTRAKLRLDLGALKFGPDGIELAKEDEVGKW